MNSDTVTCSFKMDRGLYNAYKSVITKSGGNVKGNLIQYMRDVIQYETPNSDTIDAIKEVGEMKKNPGLYKAYDSFEELLGDLDS